MKKRDGFEGEKLITVPYSVLKKAKKVNPVLKQLYIGSMGYFPQATYHYRERKKGCQDNILLYCVKGKGWYIVKNKKFEMKANEFCLIPATNEYLRYGADTKDPWTIYWVHFTGDDMDTFNKSFNLTLLDGPQEISFNEKGLDLWNIMYNNLEMGYSTENLCSTCFHLYHFIATFLYPEKHYNVKKQDARNMVNETIMYMRSKLSQQLTVEALAQKNNLSTSHFTFLFRKATGTSPMDYFIHLKLQKACLMLHSTSSKIKEIAKSFGYDDQFYFSRLFKKYMNISPLQYRSRHRSRMISD